MAGSFRHITTDEGRFISADDFPDMIENLGDAYEALEECWGMIAYLTGGSRATVANAEWCSGQGLEHGITRV